MEKDTRKLCLDHTLSATHVGRRERMEAKHDRAMGERWNGHLYQLLLVAPLLVFILIGYLAIWLGWI